MVTISGCTQELRNEQERVDLARDSKRLISEKDKISHEQDRWSAWDAEIARRENLKECYECGSVEISEPGTRCELCINEEIWEKNRSDVAEKRIPMWKFIEDEETQKEIATIEACKNVQYYTNTRRGQDPFIISETIISTAGPGADRPWARQEVNPDELDYPATYGYKQVAIPKPPQNEFTKALRRESFIKDALPENDLGCDWVVIRYEKSYFDGMQRARGETMTERTVFETDFAGKKERAALDHKSLWAKQNPEIILNVVAPVAYPDEARRVQVLRDSGKI